MRDDRLGDRGVPGRPVGVRADRLDEGRNPGAFGAGQSLDPGAVRPDRDDLGRVAGLGGGVQQRLEQGPGAGHQHHDPRRYGQLHPIGAARLRHARLLALTATCGDGPQPRSRAGSPRSRPSALPHAHRDARLGVPERATRRAQMRNSPDGVCPTARRPRGPRALPPPAPRRGRPRCGGASGRAVRRPGGGTPSDVGGATAAAGGGSTSTASTGGASRSRGRGARCRRVVGRRVVFVVEVVRSGRVHLVVVHRLDALVGLLLDLDLVLGVIRDRLGRLPSAVSSAGGRAPSSTTSAYSGFSSGRRRIATTAATPPTQSSVAGATSSGGKRTGSYGPAASRPPASRASSVAPDAATSPATTVARIRSAGTGSARRTDSPTSRPTSTGSASTAGAHTGGTPVGRAASSGNDDGTPGFASKGDIVALPTENPAPTAQLSAPTAALGR